MKVWFLFFFTNLSFCSFGQEFQPASIDYSYVILPGGYSYKESYTFSSSGIERCSTLTRQGKKDKTKKLKRSKDFAEAMFFLDSTLSAENYFVTVNSNLINDLKSDTVWQNEYGLTSTDLEIFDSLNQVRFEKKYFNRKVVHPSPNDDDYIIKYSLLEVNLDDQIMDGVPFRLKFAIDSTLKVDYCNNLYASPLKAKYSEWFSIYLMEKKYNLFDKSHPISFFYRDAQLSEMMRMYILWKKYGTS